MHIRNSQVIRTCVFGLTLVLPAFARQMPPVQSNANAPLPITQQMKKTVTFIETDCRHASGPEEITSGGPQPPIDSFYGTGFFVAAKDDRIPHLMFGYLVTNRHVVQPGIERQSPCPVVNYSIRLNLRRGTVGGSSQLIPIGANAHWVFPGDPSVDLAILPLFPKQEEFDYELIPTSEMATQDFMKAEEIAEGDTM